MTGRGKKKKELEYPLRDNLLESTKRIEPTEYEKIKEAKILNFEKQSAGSGGIESIDAMKPYLNLFNGAIQDQSNDRKSNGILTLGANGGNAQQAAGLNTYYKYKRQQDAAGMLENAYNTTNEQLTGQGFNLAGLANQRNLGRAGASVNAYNSYMHNKGPGILQGVTTGIGQIAGAGASIGQLLSF